MTTKKIKVTMTTTKRRKVSFSIKSSRRICPVCNHEVEFLTKTQAISAFAMAEDLMETLIKHGFIHIIFADNRDELICSASLANILAAASQRPYSPEKK